MAAGARAHSTGIAGLDSVLKGVLAGDNIVWQVDAIEDYRELARPFCERAVEAGRTVAYFRFASHPPLVAPGPGLEVHEISPGEGFETFIARIHSVIERAGRGAYHLFDCLSELALAWHSDQMLGNFFMLTCPYLFDLETVTYFALQRNYHAAGAVRAVTDTAQLVLDAYRHGGRLYVRPLKVQHRFSPSMYMLHVWDEDGQFRPVTASSRIAEIMTSQHAGLGSDRVLGFWEKSFVEAQEVLEAIRRGERPPGDERAWFQRLARMVFSRHEPMLELASRYLTLQDIIDVRARMIGTGLIGGKAVGMLLARAILRKRSPRVAAVLEEHDSFYVGSDVFYTFLVTNGIWWTRQQQRDPERFLEGAERARRRILTGAFEDQAVRQFEEMIDYFGQSPFIVRSSSLLEDNFGNAFAGKYDSVFCANQGPRERRVQDFLAAVRAIYASTMSERALSYRAQRGLLDQDEQMALLVMRVSGDVYGRFFFPPVAGVGYSFNPYVWSRDIDPKAGVLRLVFGLGTRAVERADDEYTRLVALNAPDRRPEHGAQGTRYAQRRADYLDLDANQLVSGHFFDVVRQAGGLPLDLLVTMDRSAVDAQGRPVEVPMLTFAELLTGTSFVEEMREMLRVLQEAYALPVDVEFTASFPEGRQHRINLVQCRPLQVQGTERIDVPRVEVDPADRIMEATGAVIGHSRHVDVARFVYVVPAAYGALPEQARYEVARLLGEINRALPRGGEEITVLLGPGRWGTTMPALGVPVSFADINRVSVLVEIVAMREHLVPDVSLGTHFLNDLVEMDMLYLALLPGQGESYLDTRFLESRANSLLALVPDAAKWTGTVRVIERADAAPGARRILLTADAVDQRALCYFASGGAKGPEGQK